ncbi:MAG: hypothetical protein FWC64_09505, partial [Treponema sp.]|nr:hypothetical protein [Treponema sp.]
AMSRQTLSKLGDGDDLVYKFTVETADKRAKADGGEIKVVFTHIVKYMPKAGTDQCDDEFTLESTDGEYKQTRGTSECRILEDGLALIAFTDVLPGKKYNLIYLNKEAEEREPYLSEVAFSELDFSGKGRI